jgi:ATP-dependent DNA helicase DinG
MTSLYKQCIVSLGISARPAQEKTFNHLCIDTEFEHTTGLFQVDTGVGKTLAVALAAAHYCLRPSNGNDRRQVIIATSTINLVNELEQCFDQLGSLFAEIGAHPSYAKLLGKTHYILPASVQLLIDSGTWAEDDVLLQKLLKWTGSIDQFIETYGDLPDGILNSDVCQTTSLTRDDWRESVELLLSNDIIITTHAMLNNDIRRSLFVSESMYLMIDEADAFIDLLESNQFTSFNLKRELGALGSLLTKKGAVQLSACIDAACNTYPDTTTYSADERLMAKVTLDAALEAMKSSKKNIEANDKQWLNDMKRYIEHLQLNITHAKHLGCSKTPKLNEPTILLLNPYFSRVFGRYAEKFTAISLLSGTLSTHHDLTDGTKWVIKKLGLNDHTLRSYDISPSSFGELQLSLITIDSSIYDHNPMRSLSAEWVEKLAGTIEGLSGKTLVLVASYEEGNMIAQHLSKAMLHKKGDKLAKSVKTFEAGDYHFLITPVGHTGVNFTSGKSGSFLDAIVITRLGFLPPSAYLEQLKYVKNLSAEHKAVLARSEYYDSVDKVIRKTKQTIGRGIRSEEDRVHVYIADPRFPKATDFTSKRSRLRYAIPKRFQSSYANHSTISSSLIPITDDSQEEIII